MNLRIRTNSNPIPNPFPLSLFLFIFEFFVFVTTQPIAAMKKVHPIPSSSMKRNVSTRDDDSHVPSKRLRRLPHVFSKVLELPFRSDADVLVEETADCFRFVADLAEEEEEEDGEEIRAHAIEVYPGVTKVVVRRGEEGDGDMELLVGDLAMDTWRFRLPGSAKVEMARATVVGGELVVTVPMGRIEESGSLGGVGRLVLVQ